MNFHSADIVQYDRAREIPRREIRFYRRSSYSWNLRSAFPRLLDPSPPPRAKNSRGRDYDYARLDISDREDFRLDFISRARPLSFLRAVQLLFSLSLSLCWLLRTFRFVVEEKVSRIRREEWWRGVVFARIAVDARERKSSEGKARCFITTLRRDVSVALGWDACVHARHCKITASKTITLQANSSRASPGQ